MLICREIYNIMGTKDYSMGEDIVPIIVVIPFLQFLYSFPVNFEFYKGKTNMIAVGTGMAAVINIIINRLLIPLYGMFATAFSTFISYFLLLFLHDKAARKIGEYHYKWNFYIKGIVPVGLCFICAYVLRDCTLMRWGLGTVIGIALVFHIKRTKSLL